MRQRMVKTVACKMPVARYFLWVGTVSLALLFIIDACFPPLPFRPTAGVPRTTVIRIYAEQKSSGPMVLDTRARATPVAVAADLAQPDSTPPSNDVILDRARQDLAQLQTVDTPPAQSKPAKPAVHHQRKTVRQHRGPPPPRIARQSQYAWFGERTWW